MNSTTEEIMLEYLKTVNALLVRHSDKLDEMNTLVKRITKKEPQPRQVYVFIDSRGIINTAHSKPLPMPRAGTWYCIEEGKPDWEVVEVAD